jgi:hypothetical protein
MRVWQPMNGWRAFAGEVGVIVLGVLIALVLGAMANEVGWRFEVAKARVQIRDEISFNFALLALHERDVPCVAQRLDAIGGIMAEASRTGRLPPLATLRGAPVALWPRGIWESQLAAQTITHYPANETAGLSRIYRRFEAFAEQDRETQLAWDELSMLAGPGRRLDPDSEGRLYAALARARRSNAKTRILAAGARQLLAETLGADYPRSAGLKPVVFGRPTCEAAAGAIPPTYGSPAG